ncbi:MAG TPA: hypothetical protein VK765_04925 [Solirubrobacteraceae bacterium]|nr:hypothetical protein [Solirubrobacteraceae bacterium]
MARGRADADPDALGRSLTRSWPPAARVAAGLALAALVIAAAAWPLVFSSATFNKDWLNHLWYMWHESVAIRERGTPSLFLNYSGGLFYPLYAFYGATLYSLVGGLSLLLGDAPLQTYVLSYVLGFAAAYGGWYWMARSFGVDGWRAHMPALVFVTSASYLTMIYALGDWPEFEATSVMPLLLAAGLSVLRARRLHFGPALALALASVVFFGSHLLTLVWGTTILVVAMAAVAACVPGARGGVTGAGVARVAALVIPGALVSAWWLLPTLSYEAGTFIAHSYPHARELLRETMYLVAAHNLFSVSHSPSGGSIVSEELPVLAIAWVVASIAILAGSGRSARGGLWATWMRLLLVISLGTVAVTVVMTHAGVMLALPRAYATLQFGFRLEGFVLLGVSGAMVCVLAMTRNAGGRLRGWTWLLVPIAIVSVVGAIEQSSDHPRGGARGAALSSFLAPPPERFGQFDYLDNHLAVDENHLPLVEFPLAEVAHGGSATASVGVARGALVATNLRVGPELVTVKGASIVGMDEQQDDVLEVTGARISVGPAASPPIAIGRVLSVLAVLALLAELAWLAARGLRGRFRRERRMG